MTDGSNIAELRAAITKAQNEIERVQGALGLVDDRCDGALALIGSASDGSSHESLAVAMSSLAAVKGSVEQNIAHCLLAIEKLESYVATRLA